METIQHSQPLVTSETSEIKAAELDRLSAEERANVRNRKRIAAITHDGAEAAAKPGAGNARGPRGRGHGHVARMHGGEKSAHFMPTMKRMLSFMSQFKLRMVLVLVFAVGSTVFGIAGPKVLAEATTALFDGALATINGTGSINFTFIGQIVLITASLYLFSAACSWVQGWLMSYISQQTCYQLRKAITHKFDRMPYAYFEKNSVGDTLSRITNDVDTLGQSFNHGVTQMITSFVTVVGIIAVMFSMNWLLALIVIAIVPFSGIVVGFVVKLSQKHFFAQQALLGRVNAHTEETFSGHALVRAYNKEDETVRLFNEANNKLYEAGWKSSFLSGLMMPFIQFLTNLDYVAVGITGAFLVAKGSITVGDIQAFIQYVNNFSQPITQLAQVSNVLQQLAAAAERIFAFLDQPEMKPDLNTRYAQSVECSVSFDDVSFGYNCEEPVIHDFSEKISEGQTVAIVGPTGAGKTTIVKLLMRFYEPCEGSISIGNVPFSDFGKRDSRSLFAMVLQDTWLFSGSIRENIRYGRLDATDEEVEEAARRACVHHFIKTLPGGYDFEINEDATNISAGQKQLITIARALIADRKMLILDEATSSVDTRTEAKIQEAMDNLMEGRTSFVIAHRLSTIRNANLIIVMDQGKIFETGTHEELIAKGGKYADLYNSQFEETS